MPALCHGQTVTQPSFHLALSVLGLERPQSRALPGFCRGPARSWRGTFLTMHRTIAWAGSQGPKSPLVEGEDRVHLGQALGRGRRAVVRRE